MACEFGFRLDDEPNYQQLFDQLIEKDFGKNGFWLEEYQPRALLNQAARAMKVINEDEDTYKQLTYLKPHKKAEMLSLAVKFNDAPLDTLLNERALNTLTQLNLLGLWRD